MEFFDFMFSFDAGYCSRVFDFDVFVSFHYPSELLDRYSSLDHGLFWSEKLLFWGFI